MHGHLPKNRWSTLASGLAGGELEKFHPRAHRVVGGADIVRFQLQLVDAGIFLIVETAGIGERTRSEHGAHIVVLVAISALNRTSPLHHPFHEVADFLQQRIRRQIERRL